MEEVRIGGSSIFVLPVVRGLPRDGRAVISAMDKLRPAVVGLSISPEELDALRSYNGKPLAPDNIEEEVYVAGLGAWEEPLKPAPCFTEAVQAAPERGMRLEALDLDEEEYTDAYTRCVSTLELLQQGRLESRLGKKRFHARTPEEFVLEWDAEVNRTPGFAALQRVRERFMADRLRALAAEARAVLGVVEVERAKGVLAAVRG